jgi:hypothetical protein
LSLAKLSSQIAASPKNNNTVVSQQQQQTRNKQWIHNKLELVQAQEILTEGEDDDETMQQDSVPSILSARDIWQQAVSRLDEKGASRLSLEEKVKFCLVGLVAAQFASEDDDKDKDAMCQPLAARVWAKSLAVDWDTTWSDLCDAPSFDRNELQTNHVASTTFYGLLQAYHTTEEDPSIAFSTGTMLDNVLEELGVMDSDGNLRDLLQVTAQLALASQ